MKESFIMNDAWAEHEPDKHTLDPYGNTKLEEVTGANESMGEEELQYFLSLRQSEELCRRMAPVNMMTNPNTLCTYPRDDYFYRRTRGATMMTTPEGMMKKMTEKLMSHE